MTILRQRGRFALKLDHQTILANTRSCAIAVTKLVAPVLEANGLPGAAAALVCGDVDVGKTVVGSEDIPLISFTGSEKVGKEVGKAVMDRFGKVSYQRTSV